MQREIDQRLGRFQLLDLLGRGGFASVYRAEDTKLRRLVAIKVLHPHLAADEAFARRFQAEARAAARLRHPHIVTVFEVGETEDGRGYLVMELLEGTLLSEIVARQSPLPFERAAPILAQLASALDYLHAHGLVHRDLKPSNVMIASDGQATLMDFGVARDLGDQGRLTRTGDMVGTPVYMAPEQIRDGEEVGPAADRYALGIVAYQLLAGRPPFVGGTASVIHDQIETLPPPPESFNLNVSPTAARAIERMLAKDPDARPASAAEFMSLLRAEAGREDLPTEVLPGPGTATGEERPGDLPTEAHQGSGAPLVAREVPALSPAALRETVAGAPGRQRPALRPALLGGSGVVLIALVIGLVMFISSRRSAGGEGLLSVITEPAGASVTVDGERIGETPLSAKKLPSGTHTVVMEKPTYLSAKRQESISADQTARVNVILTSLSTADLLRVADDAEHLFIAHDVGTDASGALSHGQVDNKVREEQQFGMVVTLAQKYPGQRDLSFRYAFMLYGPAGLLVAKYEDDTVTFRKDDTPERQVYWAYAFSAIDNLPAGVYQVKFLVNDQELASRPVELVR